MARFITTCTIHDPREPDHRMRVLLNTEHVVSAHPCGDWVRVVVQKGSEAAVIIVATSFDEFASMLVPDRVQPAELAT